MDVSTSSSNLTITYCENGSPSSSNLSLGRTERPTAPYLAAGTMAGAIDLNFSATASLEVR
eukprot:7860016-Pyramimonas_sp.AAC.1